MDPASANLSHQIFGPGPRNGDGGLRSQAEGIVEKLVVYHWPKGSISNDTQLAVLAFFAAYGKSEGISPSAWSTWVFTYMMLSFPTFMAVVRAENDREYTFRPLPTDYIESLVSAFNAAEDYDDTDPQTYELSVASIPVLAHLPEIERTSNGFPPHLAATATVPCVYGYASLLVFMAGKKITEKNVTTITERRPTNLIDAYDIPEQATYNLTGDGKMSLTSHRYINQAWVTYAPMRIAVISEVARFSTGISLAQRVVYTITKMMEYSGMQPATFIHDFLQAMPHCVNYSCIRPSLNAYTTSLREVAQAPGYLQPYYKIIHGERTRAFHRASILQLSACATAYKKYVTPSMKNFVLGEGATQAINMYDSEAARKHDVTLAGLIQPEIGSDDEE